MAIITGAVIISPYTIENIIMSETWALPGQTKSVSYELRTNAGALVDAVTTDIKVKDPSGTTRVLHNSLRLEHTPTGKYDYTFDIPDEVIEGDWHVRISATHGEDLDNAVRNVHFPVKRA